MNLSKNHGLSVPDETVSGFAYLILAFVIYVSGLATPIFRSVEMILFLFSCSFLYLIVNGLVLNRIYVMSCSVWFIYALLSYLKYMGDNLYWPFTYFVNFTIAFALIRYFGTRIFRVYSDVLYFFAALSLILFVFQFALFDFMMDLWYRFDISEHLYEKPYAYYAHAFLYTIHQFKYEEYGIPRNSGFCWEPGVFSCFIVLAIYFQLLKDRFKVDLNPVRYIVLLVALITTQSTTGFAGFLVVLICYVVNIEKTNRFKYYVLGVFLLVPFLFVLPSQMEKIENQLNNDLGEKIALLADSDAERSLERFDSIQVLFIDFINNPIIGIGADRSISYIGKLGLDVSPTSGIGNMFARYGIFLMIPFFIILYNTSFLIANFHSDKFGYGFLLIICVLGFSFSILETPIYLSLIFFSNFVRRPSLKLPISPGKLV